MGNCWNRLTPSRREGQTESANGRRIFMCDTCDRELQALGGHQLASHRLMGQNARCCSFLDYSELLFYSSDGSGRQHGNSPFLRGLATSFRNNSGPVPSSASLLTGHRERWCLLCNNYIKLADANSYLCRLCRRGRNSSSTTARNDQREYWCIDINGDEASDINKLLDEMGTMTGNSTKVLIIYGSKRGSCWATVPEMVLGITAQAMVSLISYAATGSSSPRPIQYVVVALIGVGFCSALAAKSLHRKHPKAASRFGKVGAVTAAAGFISAMGMFLPPTFIWTCLVGGVSCLIPTIALALA